MAVLQTVSFLVYAETEPAPIPQTYLIPGTSQDLGLEDPVCNRTEQNKGQAMLPAARTGGCSDLCHLL